LAEYGVLTSVRHQAGKTNDLLNVVTARFGVAIKWHVETGFHEIILLGGGHILFKKRGNKYANYLEFYSVDVELLQFIRTAFSEDFKAEVVREEGLLE
jgi:hypothetical protein